MLIAAWVLAVATAILAISGPVALVVWLNNRRADQEQRERDRAEEARDRILETARKEFVSKDGLIGSIFLAMLAAMAGWTVWTDHRDKKGKQA